MREISKEDKRFILNLSDKAISDRRMEIITEFNGIIAMGAILMSMSAIIFSLLDSPVNVLGIIPFIFSLGVIQLGIRHYKKDMKEVTNTAKGAYKVLLDDYRKEIFGLK